MSDSSTPSTTESTVNTTETVTQGTTRSDSNATADLARARDLVLSANPDVVPELVRGSTFGELLDSVKEAKAAYSAVADKVKPAEGAAVTTGSNGQATVIVPAGGGTLTVNANDLSPEAKIARGIAQRRNT